MGKLPFPKWGIPVAMSSAALLIGGLEVLLFPAVSSVDIEVFTEGMLVVFLIAGLILIWWLDPAQEIAKLLYTGTFILLLHGVSETVDEVVREPMLFTVVVEHFGIIVGVGLLLEAVRRWNQLHVERERELESMQELLNRTQEIAQVGGWELDTTSEELQWTDEVYRIHDLPLTHDVDLQETLSFYHPDDRGQITDLIEDCRENGNPFEVELRITTAADRTRWVRVTGKAVTDDGSIVALRGTLRDITPEKERQQNLSVLNRVLRHNLRNDLNVLIGQTEQILRGLSSLDTADKEPTHQQHESDTDSPDRTRIDRLKEQAQSVSEKSRDLLSLSETVRQYNNLTTDSEVIEPTPLKPLLEQLVTDKESTHPAATIHLQCPAELTVLCTPQQLEKALAEIVENSIIHTESDKPTVNITATRVESERVELRIRDRGPGIADSELAALVNRDASPLDHGSGLGLWFVSSLIARQNGDISVSEPKGKGTIITVRLPAERETLAAPENPSERSGQPLRQYRS